MKYSFQISRSCDRLRCLVAAPGYLLGLAACIGMLAVLGASSQHRCVAQSPAAKDEKAEPPTGLPPLVVDEDAPLLLDQAAEPDKTSGQQESTQSQADNSACHVCHENYREEPLVRWHARHDVGCTDCHGDSYAHRNDENNVTPPDVMYPAGKIDEACGQCHDSHDVPAQKVLARYRARCAHKTDPKSVVCTDCHGHHRLKSRTVRWNKKTRKLIETP